MSPKVEIEKNPLYNIHKVKTIEIERVEESHSEADKVRVDFLCDRQSSMEEEKQKGGCQSQS